MSESTNVAIACQGGGSHTAFTAGVLETLLQECDWEDEYELVGISGTSGGAFNALAVWYGLVVGDVDTAAELLDQVWDDLSADSYSDRLMNTWLTNLARLEASGMPVPQLSPYQIPGPEVGKERIRTVLESHIDFDSIPDYCQADAPDLVIGTVNINAGVFETFVNEAVTVEAVLASAAVPTVFEAVEINGHLHWDGQFSQNPPISDLMRQPPARKPEELWVVQINPQELDGEPTSLEDVADRRNELSGNISLNQELRFIERVNDWVETGKLPADEFTHTEIHRLEMDQRFRSSTKFDRDPGFIDRLTELGRERAETFLAGH
jgi:NTE family protein